MFDDLNEHEIGTLVVALKYWRANRLPALAACAETITTTDTINLLLAKLESNLLTAMTSRDRLLSRLFRG